MVICTQKEKFSSAGKPVFMPACIRYSVSKYISLIRLYKARQLLQTTQMNISEIAYELGFSDPSYFTKAFREAFAVTPTELRS